MPAFRRNCPCVIVLRRRVSSLDVSLPVQTRNKVGLRDHSGKPPIRIQNRDMVVPVVREHGHEFDDRRRRVDRMNVDVHQGATFLRKNRPDASTWEASGRLPLQGRL